MKNNKTYNRTITVDSETAEYIRHKLENEPKDEVECMPENYTIHRLASFPYGYEMEIKCCGVKYDENEISNKPWTEAVLFKNGCEVGHTDVEDYYFGEWEMEHDGITFKVTVV